jgi:hypothetical protein
MGLILRTSSLANAGDSISVKGTALEYSEGDGNFMYLLSNMSGSIVTITGDTALTGSLNISTILNATTDTDRFLVSDAGIIKYRSGSQILADIAANLQNVTDTGATTTNVITVGGVTGSLFGTASWASRAVSSSYALTATSASYAQTASYVLNAISASYVLNAVSASYAPNLYNSDGALLGNRIVNLTGSTLTFISGSITGSNDALINGTTAGAGAGAEWTVFGVQAASKASNSYGVAIGYKALSSSLSTGGVAVGRLAARDTTTGTDNTAIGTNALMLNTTGQENTAIGGGAISDIVRGSFNTSVGKNNLRGILTGSYNTSVGWLFTTGILTGSYNTIIGASITGLSSTLNNNIILADGQGNIKYRWDASANNIYGQLNVSGSLRATSSVFFPNLTAANQSNIVTIDTTTGQLYYTGSTTFIPISSISASYVSGSSAIVTRLQVSGSATITNELTLTGSLFISGSSNSAVINNGFVVLTQVSQSLNFANDAAASAGGVPLGGLYRNGNVIAIRIS